MFAGVPIQNQSIVSFYLPISYEQSTIVPIIFHSSAVKKQARHTFKNKQDLFSYDKQGFGLLLWKFAQSNKEL